MRTRNVDRTATRAEAALLFFFAAFLILLARDGWNPGYRAIEPVGLGSIVKTGLVMAAELALFYAIIRPRSFFRSFDRALAATAVFTPLAFVSVGICMHAPSYFAVHAVWLFALVAVSIGLTAWTVLARIIARFRKEPTRLPRAKAADRERRASDP